MNTIPARYTKRVAALTMLLMTIALVPVTAQGPGDLLVTPTRAVFENGRRFETLTLINRGRDTTRYRISVIQYRMTAEGSLQRIDSADPGQHFATDMIRFFPREVTIAPGETQNVRVQIRGADSMPEGEYRSHLYLRGVGGSAAAGTPVDSARQEFAVRLNAVYGVTVPIIIRVGAPTVAVTMKDVALTPGDSARRPSVTMTFVRSGEASTCGSVRAIYHPSNGAPMQVGVMSGVSVYTPNTERRFHLPLTLPEGTDLSDGRLEVKYVAQNAEGEQQQVLATAAVELN